MKIGILAIITILNVFFAKAQHNTIATDTITVTGKVKTAVIITLADLKAMKSVPLKDLVITNHLGEVKRTVTGLKGVLAKDVLAKLEFASPNPKLLSEYYLTFVASDGYKVVYSWNEIFNTETGNNVYFITEKEGQKLSGIKDRILVACMTDFKTGRRYVEGLAKIVVGRVE